MISIVDAKQLAKRLRATLRVQGTNINHSRALEIIAHDCGFKDWNTLSSSLSGNATTDTTVGKHVRGYYLSQPFTAIITCAKSVQPGWQTLHLTLDAAVDVVTSRHFSNFRKRIFGTVGPAGHSREKTSNGRAQLEIELIEVRQYRKS